MRRKRRIWTEAQIALLRQLYADTPTKELARRFRRPVGTVYQKANALGLRKSPEYIETYCRNLDPETGRAYRFSKGQTPANKGLRRPGWHSGRMRETQFRKGHKPKTWVPVGTEVVDADGYRKRKIRDDAPTGMSRRNWAFVHVLVWTEANGPVPPKHAIAFRDGDRSNVSLENLECIHRRELARRNHISRLPEPVKQAIHAKAALQRQINKRRRGDEEQDRRAA